jgi:hypothetical protein
LEKIELFDGKMSLAIEMFGNKFNLMVNGKKIEQVGRALTSGFIKKMISTLEDERQKELERKKTFYVFCFSHKFFINGKKTKNLLILYFYKIPNFYRRLRFISWILYRIKYKTFKLSDSVRNEWLKQLKSFAKHNNITLGNDDEFFF